MITFILFISIIIFVISVAISFFLGKILLKIVFSVLSLIFYIVCLGAILALL